MEDVACVCPSCFKGESWPHGNSLRWEEEEGGGRKEGAFFAVRGFSVALSSTVRSNLSSFSKKVNKEIQILSGIEMYIIQVKHLFKI